MRGAAVSRSQQFLVRMKGDERGTAFVSISYGVNGLRLGAEHPTIALQM